MRPPKADVEAAIRETGGNLTRAAARLDCTRQTLYVWIYQYGLQRLAGVRTLEGMIAAPVNGSGPVPFTVRVPAALYKWAKIRAISADQTTGAVVTEALELLRAVVEGPEKE